MFEEWQTDYDITETKKEVDGSRNKFSHCDRGVSFSKSLPWRSFFVFLLIFPTIAKCPSRPDHLHDLNFSL